MEQTTICPWCQTEIVWDEELGPEERCPYCDNELTGYRTVQIGLDRPDDGDSDWDVEGEAGDDTGWADNADGFRHTDREWLAVEETVERVLDGQEEVPECPSCREYMLEAGMQTIGEAGFRPAVPKSLGQPLLEAPFGVVWYVCPSCFQTVQRIAPQDRDRFLAPLRREAEAAADNG
ncbi:hypothetical protein IJ21_39620 [Paenibacillus sp. 32O-W]|jgi:hypothetical protein|uniref:Uncharacterized protein n=1 Tax=Paenibacillus cisolokensis TaxID=1658519 RepID=A0ABQ4NDA2_9BACL|nr:MULTISPECIES: hypothetical protein [Paenibacillus]ALS29348.1 hypothetical protein IJ21_39620 [Paenibacillus sp. 32O-W]GIQ66225.1 hypothetical protein PACILC2_47930 [Paenibacillus cisolokensis]